MSRKSKIDPVEMIKVYNSGNYSYQQIRNWVIHYEKTGIKGLEQKVVPEVIGIRSCRKELHF